MTAMICNVICAICWLGGAIRAIVAPAQDYRLDYIISAFCVALFATADAVIIGYKLRKNKQIKE